MSPPVTIAAPPTPAPAATVKTNGTHLPDVDFKTDSIEEALTALKDGEMILVLDDYDRENEADFVIAAEKCTTEQMAFIIKHSSGYVCVCLPPERVEELELPMMYPQNTERHKTAYTITVDHFEGTTTGISAHDRAFTSRALANPTSKPSDFSRPGHILPLRAVANGVFERRGHTEAAVDLAKLAGLSPAAVICELVKPDDPMGSMARKEDSFAFARKHGLKLVTIRDLVTYRQQHSL
ncbi:3,4-dihydroxy-2-butanone 4-phosphate synthase [Atractiella rhizophila]|nr:3,4-dihydroxy-2-butanone 4-phosphate synthase [Atractiella rhizophila]